jgi:mRNA-degrading endonuclease toxin of MazEF toxin-antitoxin module
MRRWSISAVARIGANWRELPRNTSTHFHRMRWRKKARSLSPWTNRQKGLILTVSPSAGDQPRRGDIWSANTGGKRHAVVILSLDSRNLSDRADSVLIVPFGSFGGPGPTVIRMEPGETGLPEPSFLKAHFISVLKKSDLIARLPRRLSNAQMRGVVAAVNRAIDPDAPFEH